MKMNRNGIILAGILFVLIVIVFPAAADYSAAVEPKNFQGDLFTGAVSTSMTIRTFEGAGGLSPKLSMSYSSLNADQLRAQSGWISPGWSLAGSNDRVVRVGQYGYILIINGIGYNLVLGSDGYHTNPESFLKITQETDGWKAVDTDGTSYYFGRTDATKLFEAIQTGSDSFTSGSDVVEWYLEYIEDVNGNGMKYYYTKYTAADNHEYSIIPAKIECCYHAQTLASNPQEIIFITSKKDVEDINKKSGYWTDRRLDVIEIKINGNPLRKYELGYDQKNNPQTGDNFENPGFETGNKNGWSTTSELSHSAVVISDEKGGYYLRMHLDGYLGKVQAWQDVVVPRTASFLKYKVIISAPFDEFNGLGVYLFESGNEYQIDHVKEMRSSSGEERTVDLSRWAGEKVKIYFRTENLVGDFGAGEVYLDDVSLGVDSSETGPQTLKSVTEYGSDGTSYSGTLPPTIFEHDQNLLTGILNGHGGKSGFKYEPFFARTEYRGGYEKNERHRVTEKWYEDGMGSRTMTHIAYQNDMGESTDLFSTEDQEFRGHGQVTVTGPSGEKNIFFFNQSDEAKGVLERTEAWGNDGNVYGSVKNTIDVRTTKINLPSEDQLLNSGFEGNTLGWKTDFVGSGYAGVSDEASHSGGSSLKLSAGGGSSGKVEASQEILLSQDVKWMSFYARSVTAPAGSGFEVFIKNESGEYQIVSGIPEDEWTLYKKDMSAWANQKVTVIFRAYQEYENSPEIMSFVDDVTLLHRTDIVSFPFVSEIREFSYEVSEDAKMTLTTFARDEFGNVIDTKEYGEYDDAAGQDVGTDKRQTIVEYINDKDRNILGVPKHSTVYGFDINNEYGAQRESWMYYDNMPFGELIKGQLTKTEARKDNGNNISTEMGYDVYGNVNWTIDANRNINPVTGHTTDTEYDGIYPVKFCNALNYCNMIGYDDLKRPINFTDINGQLMLTELDNFGREIKLAKPGDSLEAPTIQTVYQNIADFANGTYPFVLSILKDGTVDGLRSYRFSDGFGNVIQTKAEGVGENEWLVADTLYCGDECSDQNSRGRLDRNSVPYTITTDAPEVVNRKNKDEIGIWTVQGYDSIGRNNKITKPDGTYTETVFGVWRTDSFDAMHHKTSAYTDGLGMANKIENYLGNSSETYQLYATTSSKYNTGSGELVKLTDPAGNEQIIGFNMLGWKIWTNDSDLGNWSYSHDNNGNMINQTDAKGQTIKFVLDALNRVILKDYPTDYDTAFFYDDLNSSYGKGNLYRVDSYSGGTAATHTEKNFYRDERGRVIKEETKINENEWEIGKGYDSLDRVINTTYPDGEIVTVRRNKAGIVDSPDGIIPAIQSNLYDGYSYLKDVTFWQGKPESYIYGNGRTTVREYNDRTGRTDLFTGKSFTYQLLNLRTDGGIQDLQYGRDDNGNVRIVVDGINPDYSVSYAQDDLSRLVSAESVVSGKLEFSYDNIGNILSKDGLSYVYPLLGSKKPHAPISFGKKQFEYDGNGNMEKIKNDLTPPVPERHTLYALKDMSNSAGETMLWYDYDNMVNKITDGDQTKELFGYDEAENRVVKEENNTKTYYVGGVYEEEWVNEKKETIVKYYSLGDATAVRRMSLMVGTNNLSFVHTDHLGSSSRVTDVDGTLTMSMGYKPYGEEAYATGQADIKRLFAGKEKDEGTGLYYYGARYYDPSLARFISPDPVEGPNRYEYVKNNPVNMIDPSGNFVMFAAVPYVIAALPTITLAATGYFASNWNEDIGAGLTGADVVSFAMPLPIPSPGKTKIGAAIAMKIEALKPDQIKKVAGAWERWDLFKSKKNAEGLVEIGSNVRNTRVKTRFNSMLPQTGKAEHMKGNWVDGAFNIDIGQKALRTPGNLDATILHECCHDLQWRGRVPIEPNLFETQAYDVSLQTHLLYIGTGRAEADMAKITYEKAIPYAKLAEEEAGKNLGYLDRFNEFYDNFIKPRI